ncbi:Subtilisin-like protease 5.4, partial [Cucurbita argyrosperma subsp. sororia]
MDKTPDAVPCHGSHTLSTAGGSYVSGVSVFGFGIGTTKGGSPKARVTAYKGSSLSRPLAGRKLYPLITGAQAKATTASADDAMLCKPKTLDHSKVNGKILVCLTGGSSRIDKGMQVVLTGAVGMILCNDRLSGFKIIADLHVIPASHISYDQAVFSNPMGYLIPPSSKVNIKPSPTMAAFSSRGPDMVSPKIIKPDVTASRVKIIAAFSGVVSPTGEPFDNRTVPYITMSGTSMSCPQVSSIVGLLKVLHPEWSPAAINSAIMTSARISDNTMNLMLDAPLSSLQLPPSYMGKGTSTWRHRPRPCLRPLPQQLLRIPLRQRLQNLIGSVTLTRRLKNVGRPGVYRVRVRQPEGVKVSMKPSVLKFWKIGKEKRFELTMTGALLWFLLAFSELILLGAVTRFQVLISVAEII